MEELKSMDFTYSLLSWGLKLFIKCVTAVFFSICAFNIDSVVGLFYFIFGIFAFFIYFLTDSTSKAMLVFFLPFLLIFGSLAAFAVNIFLNIPKSKATITFYDTYAVLS